MPRPLLFPLRPLFATLAMAVLAGCATPPPTAPDTAARTQTAQAKTVGWQRVHLGGGAAGYDFPVYANHALDAMDAAARARIREVIFVQHGLQRNGGDYYAAGLALLAATGRDPAEVLLIAPNFPGPPDKDKDFDGMPRWTVQGWISGEDAVNAQRALSSLQVLDDLVGFVTDRTRFPGVTRVTVAGHSGGAQIVHRYAVLNNIDESTRARGIDVRYVVANPSSYLYFTPERPAGADGRSFAPYDTAVCPGYDKYRYGMRDMVPYARCADGMTLFRRYARRQVTYLVGSEDNDPNHRVLDKACGAQAEGPTRLQRARGYLRYERYLAGAKEAVRHQSYEVVGIGHDQAGMFGSQCGAAAVFGLAASANAAGAACRAPGL